MTTAHAPSEPNPPDHTGVDPATGDPDALGETPAHRAAPHRILHELSDGWRVIHPPTI